MDNGALILYTLLIMWSVSIVYVQYQIYYMLKILREVSKICVDAVNSLRNGGV